MLNTLHSAPTRHQLRLRLSCRRVLVAPGPARLHQLLPSRIFDVSSFEDEPRASVVARSARSANPKKKSSRPRRPSGAPSAGTARPRTPRGAAVTEDGDEDDEESGLGWWENPAERDLQAFAPKPLKDWQNHKLELAYTQGRRKMPIQQLAEELDVDRAVVLGWIKEFSAKPASDREAVMAACRTELDAQRIRDGQQRVADAALRLPPLPAGTPQGFVPYYQRKEAGTADRKRLSAETLRTLESLYDRTPFPSNDMIRGLWDLHRLHRDVAIQWFEQRRAVDGIESSTQKRRSKARGSPFPSEEDMWGPAPGARRRRGGADGEEGDGEGVVDGDDLLQGLAGQARDAEAEAQAVRQYTLTKRMMAQLRSSMPSPKKLKGQKMAEQYSIKTDDVGGQSITQIGSVRFVSADGSKEWRKAWGVRRNVQAAVSGAPPAAAASVGGGGDGSGGGSSGGRGRRSKLGRASPSSASDAIDLDSMADDETR